MLMLQEMRTPADEARCREEVAMTAFWFRTSSGRGSRRRISLSLPR